jgi:alpha-mannosidase
MIKVHVIFNAHLDPIWLWSWRDGLDEVLNTTRYICDLLDRHPDIIFTRGEAWVYEQVLRVDPKLFERVCAHVRVGRWSIVGGWYIQPDCNLPSGFAIDRQIALGQAFFREHFDDVPTVAYNVDSFGHAATLPGYMRTAGQSSYVMMRPQEHEMKLPARIFRWRGYREGPEVTTFRIAAAYCTPAGLTEEHLRAAATEVPGGVSHTMCFLGIGDHGGGPTEEMIAWCREKRTAMPGLEIVFSSPARFFAALEPERDRLPLVVGELQMHAIGCYSVHRAVKLAMRKAEHRLVQTEAVLEKFSAATPETAADLKRAWKIVCFHHFHDTLGGTCIPTAYEYIHAQLGGALATAEEIAVIALRRHLTSLCDDPAQRLMFFNASERPYRDFVEIEPWLEWTDWQPAWRLLNERGESMDYQIITGEGGQLQGRLLFYLELAPGELATLRIADGSGSPNKLRDAIEVSGTSIHSPAGTKVELRSACALELPTLGSLPLPELASYEDTSDTWSHLIDRYERKARQAAVWQPPAILDRGPLMASLVQQGALGASHLQAEWRLYRDRPWIDCHLRVVFMEQYRVLKWEIRLPADVAHREDGIAGGSLVRAMDGRELPLRDWTRFSLVAPGGKPTQLAILSPDIYSLDGEPRRLGLTLLRSPLMAWHIPNPGHHPHRVFSDRGEHFFRFRFLPGDISGEALDEMAFAWQRAPLTADVTRGMARRALRENYVPAPAAAAPG